MDGAALIHESAGPPKLVQELCARGSQEAPPHLPDEPKTAAPHGWRIMAGIAWGCTLGTIVDVQIRRALESATTSAKRGRRSDDVRRREGMNTRQQEWLESAPSDSRRLQAAATCAGGARTQAPSCVWIALSAPTKRRPVPASCSRQKGSPEVCLSAAHRTEMPTLPRQARLV